LLERRPAPSLAEAGQVSFTWDGALASATFQADLSGRSLALVVLEGGRPVPLEYGVGTRVEGQTVSVPAGALGEGAEAALLIDGLLVARGLLR
jgi:hypothetical protein